MATVKAFIRVSKKKAEKANIRFRLSDGRIVQLFHKSELTIEPNLWDPEKEMVKAKVIYDNRDVFNNSVTDRKKIILQAYNTAPVKTQLTSDWLELEIDKLLHPEKYLPPETLRKTFFQYWDEFLAQRKLSDVRIKNYQVVGRSLKRFELYNVKTRGKSFNLDFNTITPDILRELESFLKKEDKISIEYPDIYKAVEGSRTKVEPRGQNTLNGIFTKIRTFFLWAIELGKTTNNPFKNFKVEDCIYGTPYYISIEERNQLYKTDLTERPELAVQRDIFVFQCLIGCRMGDLLKMTKSNLINKAIEYIPRKSKDGRPITVRVPLNPIAEEILNRYADAPDKKLLPFISAQNYNLAIKEAFLLTKLTRMVTIINQTTREEEKRPLNEIASSHLARRSFIGNLYKQVKDPNLVGSLSGHKEGSKAFARYREIDEEMKKDLVNLLN